MLYKSLAVGTISILAPISATGVILPVIWGLCSGDAVSRMSLLGIIIAIAGSLMAVIEKDPESNTKKLTRGIGLAAGSAVLVGIYFITMDRACTFHPVWASIITRVSTLIVLIPVVMFTKPVLNTGKAQLGFLVFMGLMDTSAAFCFALAASRGMLSQVAVISSLYPAVTVILSTIIAKERIRKIQGAGVFLAITGITLISAF
jgi:drug/metabolite transporter (DMT)-like permease